MKLEQFIEVLHEVIGKDFQLRKTLDEVYDAYEYTKEEGFYGFIGEQAEECIRFILDAFQNYEDVTLIVPRKYEDLLPPFVHSTDCNYLYYVVSGDISIATLVECSMLYDGVIDYKSAIHYAEKFVDYLKGADE